MFILIALGLVVAALSPISCDQKRAASYEEEDVDDLINELDKATRPENANNNNIRLQQQNTPSGIVSRKADSLAGQLQVQVKSSAQAAQSRVVNETNAALDGESTSSWTMFFILCILGNNRLKHALHYISFSS